MCLGRTHIPPGVSAIEPRNQLSPYWQTNKILRTISCKSVYFNVDRQRQQLATFVNSWYYDAFQDHVTTKEEKAKTKMFSDGVFYLYTLHVLDSNLKTDIETEKTIFRYIKIIFFNYVFIRFNLIVFRQCWTLMLCEDTRAKERSRNKDWSSSVSLPKT